MTVGSQTLNLELQLTWMLTWCCPVLCPAPIAHLLQLRSRALCLFFRNLGGTDTSRFSGLTWKNAFPAGMMLKRSKLSFDQTGNRFSSDPELRISSFTAKKRKRKKDTKILERYPKTLKRTDGPFVVALKFDSH